MKKRLVAIALIAVAILGIFTSCEKKEVAVDPNAPVKLTVWCWDPTLNIYAMNEAAKIYAKDHPNVEVEVVETPWEDLQQKLITSLSANTTENLPDIILCQDNAIQKNLAYSILQLYHSLVIPYHSKQVLLLQAFANANIKNGDDL